MRNLKGKGVMTEDGNRLVSKLAEGNLRFLGLQTVDPDPGSGDGAQPFAAILGCADSRVPPEIVFGQSVGDLFVVRVAGSVVSPSALGSLELGVEGCNLGLLVVLGHTDCAAVCAALAGLPEEASSGLQTIVDFIRPSVVSGTDAGSSEVSQAVVNATVTRNVEEMVRLIPRLSRSLRKRIDEKRLKVVGAVYSVETGRVEFLDQ